MRMRSNGTVEHGRLRSVDVSNQELPEVRKRTKRKQLRVTAHGGLLEKAVGPKQCPLDKYVAALSTVRVFFRAMNLVRITPVILVLCLGMVQDSIAAPKGKLVGFIAEYDELKESVLKTLSDADEARSQGYSSDPKELLKMLERASELLKEIMKYRQARRTESMRANPRPEDLPTLFVLVTAANALMESVGAELSYQNGEKSPFTMSLRAKHEDILRFADEELRKLVRQ